MAERRDSFVLIKQILPQVINEGATFGPLKLYEYIQSAGGTAHFRAELADGRSLPQGLICTAEGLINGIPAAGTQGAYKVKVTAENELGEQTFEFDFTIKTRIAMEGDKTFEQLKSQVWEALAKNLPLPDLSDLLERPISPAEIYYLLERFAYLKVWDVYNLEIPGERKELALEGASPHYHIYDRGSCLVALPKELFSHERTLEDALQTSRAMAREVYKRGWVVELVGFHKMARAAWIEIQSLGDKFGKRLEVLHYSPTTEDIKLYAMQSKAAATRDFNIT